MTSAGIVVFPGSNCEQDCERALRSLGADTVRIWHEEESLGNVDTVVLPGGFAHGDYLRTGAIARFSPVMRAVRRHADEGGLVIGICNGFQILCEAGILPGALRKNSGLKFLCKWTNVRIEVSGGAFTARGEQGQVLRLPINHFEGNWYADSAVLDRMKDHDQIVLRYAGNPNGSLDDVAGITNEQHNVLGMMPHPERACEAVLGSDDGTVILGSMLDYAAGRAPRPAAVVTAAGTFAHRDLGLTDDEYEAIQVRLGRVPTNTELAMFSVMWSEHCSYKSSRAHLRSLPTEGDRILVGPGEGAGVVEVAPGVAVAWKIESHNHPSFVEPSNGAATGIGGIVRDILSMGARPIALLDSLRFGPLEDHRSRYLLDGIVQGISTYGNSIGVPTVGGETIFDDCYTQNPLVNAACLGVVEARLMHGRAESVGDAVVLFGASTGRDGIGGASVLASAGFDEGSAARRPSVQVGDPFTEKLLIEASLELIDRGLVAGFQDLGAGGISCPVSEMAAKGGTGMQIDIAEVHRREPGMEPFEVMISESQERMMAVVAPADVDAARDVCRRWGLEARVIGEVTKTGRVEVLDAGRPVADVPAPALADEGPIYDRPLLRPSWVEDLHRAPVGDDPPPEGLREALLGLLGSANICSKHWVWEQYDHMIFLGTIRGPGHDAAVVRLPGRSEAVALSLDGPGRYCYLDPYEGARLAVAEAARNVACTGASPVAITNCLNFGNPERPEVMWQFAEVVRGLGDACRDLGTPVTGGNVSFYNETGDRAIHPTPVVGMLGVLERAEAAVGIGFSADGDDILLLGATDPSGFGGSEYAMSIHRVVGGRPPHVDLERELALIGSLCAAAEGGLLSSAHDVSAGGLAVALCESAISGGRGFAVTLAEGSSHRVLFSESPSRALVSCPRGATHDLVGLASEHGLPARRIGQTGGMACDFESVSVPLKTAADIFENSLAAHLSDSIG